MTTYLVVPSHSHWLWVGRKRTTEDRQAPWEWPPSVSLYLHVYFIYTQGVVARWLLPATLDREVSGTGFGCRGVALCPWARHFTYMYTLSTQEWTGTWLGSDCVWVWIVFSPVMAAGVYVPSSSWAGTETNRSHNQGTLVKATISPPLAASCLSAPIQSTIYKKYTFNTHEWIEIAICNRDKRITYVTLCAWLQ